MSHLFLIKSMGCGYGTKWDRLKGGKKTRTGHSGHISLGYVHMSHLVAVGLSCFVKFCKFGGVGLGAGAIWTH